jgi:signal transduction histidine kinase
LQLKQQSPSLNKKVGFIIGINILMGVSSAIGYYLIPVWDFWWQHANMFFTFSIFVYPMFILRKTKVKYSKFITRGSICLIISILCNIIFSSLGVDLTYCDSMILLGTFIEILFFNYALQYKIKDQERDLLLSEINKQKAIKEEYSRVAADLHDEVGSTLSSIHINSVVSAKKIEVDVLESKKLLQLISKQSKKMQHNLSDIVWGLRTDLDNIEDFTAKLQEIMEQTLGVIDINYSIGIDDELTQIKLSVLQRRNLLLIAKEAFNNCVKYADASLLKVSFDLSNNVLQMKIADDGKGFSLTDVGNTSNGLTNISNRISQLNGTVQIISNGTDGTTILCEMPL